MAEVTDTAFREETTGLCPTCLRTVPALIFADEERELDELIGMEIEASGK
jgi:uncharacterized radical SAM superfamily Fe-S cluster-containing enzyme